MKDMLNIDKIMNQKQENMERCYQKMLSMVLLSYSIGLLIGETIRESVYTEKKRKLYNASYIRVYIYCLSEKSACWMIR